MNSSANIDAPAEGSKQSREKRVGQIAESISAILLGIAALASSWAGYQATRWSGVQASNYSRANALRIEASRVSALANQRQAIDIGFFVNWLNAHVAGHEREREYFRKSFRPEFVPAFDTWLAAQSNTAPPTVISSPFSMPEYKSSLNEEADKLEAKAKENFKVGEAANEQGDAYVLNSVILSSVLFFAGIAPQFKLMQLRMAVLVVATFLCVIGLYRLAIYPVT